MNKRGHRTALLLACLLSVAHASGQQVQLVQETTIDRQVKEIASELRCPVCQGLSLQASPSELAQEMRAVIRRQLEEGKTPRQVKQYFVSKYGEWILLEPQAHGFNLVAYVLPLVAFAGGGVVIYLLLKRWVRPVPANSVVYDDEESIVA